MKTSWAPIDMLSPNEGVDLAVKLTGGRRHCRHNVMRVMPVKAGNP